MNLPAPLRLLVDAVKVWVERDAFQHAGSLAFFTLFSMAPLVIILVSIVGAVYGQQAASGEISAGISGLLGEQAAAAVEEAVRRSRPEVAGFLPTAIGIGALVFGATTVFAQMQGALNHFWDVRAKPTRSGILTFITVRLLSLGMVLGLTALEFLVAFLQAFVFAVLTCIYLNDVVNLGEGH